MDRKIILRKLKYDDASQMYNWASDEAVTKYVMWDVHKDINETQGIINTWIEKYKKEDFFMWGIELIETEEFIGTISVVEIDKVNNSCEVGYAIGKKWWSKGYTTKALKYVVNYLLDFVGFEEVVCKAQSLNIGSICVMKKCGMNYKGSEKGFIDKTTKKEDKILIYSTKKEDYLPFNKLYFKFESPTYSDIVLFYRKLFARYNKKIKKVNDNLYDITTKKNDFNNITTYRNVLAKRKQLLLDLIKENINYFESLKSMPITIYLNGSFARNNSRVNSDIDLNFMYPNKYIKKFLPLEEVISFIIGNVFDIDYRDRVHPMGYLMLKNKYKINKSKFFITCFKNNDMLISECRINCYDIMYECYNMPRSYKDICSYLNVSNNLFSVNEFVYNNEVVFSNTKNFISDTIKNSDLKIVNNKNFLYYSYLNVERIIEEIEYQIEILDTKVEKIRDFKKIYKTIPNVMLYKFLSVMKRLLLYRNGLMVDVKVDKCFLNTDFLNLLGTNLKELERTYYNYLFDLTYIEKVFKDERVDFSSHTDASFSKIDEKYNIKYGIPLDTSIKESLTEYYNLLLINFERVKNIYE